jgi:acetylornithine deacetylase
MMYDIPMDRADPSMSLTPDGADRAGAVLGAVDVDRAVDLVRQVCRIPSVLGEEGELAGFLSTLMEDAGFEAVKLQPVLPERSNAVGETPNPSPTVGR